MDIVVLDIIFWAITLSFSGKVLLALSVILVHGKITKERRIDGIVLMEMHNERYMAVVGLILMGFGYLLELEALNYINFF